jgi:hypothetical protein
MPSETWGLAGTQVSAGVAIQWARTRSGMIRKRGDKWTVLVYDPATRGKRWVGTYDSKRDAGKAEAQAKLERRRKREETETCDSFADRWMTDYPRERESTNMNYAERIKKFARDFKGVPLSDISRPVARKWAVANQGHYKTVRAMFSDAHAGRPVRREPVRQPSPDGSRGRVILTC